MNPKFKVGDKVRVIEDDAGYHKPGTQLIITGFEVAKLPTRAYYYVFGDKKVSSDYKGLYEDEIELIGQLEQSINELKKEIADKQRTLAKMLNVQETPKPKTELSVESDDIWIELYNNGEVIANFRQIEKIQERINRGDERILFFTAYNYEDILGEYKFEIDKSFGTIEVALVKK